MTTGFVLIRAWIYGKDFTEFNENGQIVIHRTRESAEAEAVNEYMEWLEQVRAKEKSLDEVCFDLSVANCIKEGNTITALENEGFVVATCTGIHESQRIAPCLK